MYMYMYMYIIPKFKISVGVVSYQLWKLLMSSDKLEQSAIENMQLVGVSRGCGHLPLMTSTAVEESLAFELF